MTHLPIAHRAQARAGEPLRGSRRSPSGIRALLLTPLACGLAGCANPGVPRPPTLNLPKPVADLTASRVGDRVQLRWTAPTGTTDGLEMRGATTTVICRDPVAAALPGSSNVPPESPGKSLGEASCTPVLQLPGHPGPSSAASILPAGLSDRASAPVLVAYRVRVLNGRGRSAQPSPPAWIPGGPPVAPVEGFHATQARNGVLLQWVPGPSPAPANARPESVLVTRIAIDPVPSPALPASPAASSRRAPSGASAKKSPFDPGSRASAPAEVRLTADPVASGRDPGGMLDQSAATDRVYSYSAQRVRAFPRRTIEALSEPSPAVRVPIRDTFAPEPPRGLACVPGSQPDTRPGAAATPTLDLSWEPNEEPDLAGYNIYREDLASAAAPAKLNAHPLAAPAYRDATLLAEHRYRYRVTAIDRGGNESGTSAPVVDTAAAP